MQAWDRLLEISKILMGPNGCPWDKEQTLLSLQPYILEEAHELIETIDSLDPLKMKEELGDFIYTAIFVANLAEKENLFSLKDSLEVVAEKLIRRHPHIFSDARAGTSEDVMKNWELIKDKEGRKTLFEGIPPTLPALSRAQKIFSKLYRRKMLEKKTCQSTEEQLAEKVMILIQEAEASGIDLESAVRRACLKMEKEYE